MRKRAVRRLMKSGEGDENSGDESGAEKTMPIEMDLFLVGENPPFKM